MRRYIIITTLTIMIAITHSPVFAQETPVKKLSRGVVNILTAPIEIPKQARAYWIEGAQVTDHIIIWTVCGVGKGIVEGIKRGSSGLWDVVSFPFAVPEDYKPLIKPDYVFADWPSDPDVFIFKRKD